MAEEVKATAKIELNIDDLQANLEKMKRSITRANAVFKQETAGMSNWTKDADGLSAKLKNLDTVLKEQQRILQNYRDQLAYYTDKQKEAEGYVKKHTEALKKMEKDGIDPNSDAYKKQQRAIEEAVAAQRRAEDQCDALRTKIDKQKASIETTEASIEKWTQAQEDYIKESNSLDNVVKNQEKALRDLKKEYVNVATSEGSTSDAAKTLETQIFDLSGELLQNKKRLEEAEKAADELDRSYEAAGKGAVEAGEESEKGASLFQRSMDNFIGGVMVDGITRAWDGVKNAIKGAVSAMKDAVADGAAYADNILTLSSQTGIGTEALQEFAYMEELVDVSTGTIANSMKRMKLQISSAAKGSKNATASFEKLGISIYDSNGNLRDSEEIYREALEALAGIENETERDTAAMDLFGRSAADLNPLIEAGSEKLEALKKEAHDTGAVLSGDALKSLGAAKDGMDRLSKSVETAKTRFASNLAPAVTEATDILNGALNNPRTQLALDNLSQGIGKILEEGAKLISDILPNILTAFSADTRIVQYTDEQLEAYQAMNETKKAHEELAAEYSNNAQTILDEKGRITDLWQELKTLADKNGEVQDKDKERAEYILHELNDALGTEYEMNGKIIQNYQDMNKELGNLIQQRTAEALLAAGRDQYTKALNDQSDALSRAANFSKDLEEAQGELEKAQQDYAEALEYVNQKYKDDEYGVNMATSYMQEYENALGAAQRKVNALTEDYDTARGEYLKYTETIDRYQRAESAALQGYYAQVVDVLANETGATLEYYRKKKELSDQDKENLNKTLEQQKRDYEEYEKALKEGQAGHSKERLAQMEKEIQLTNAIISGNTELARYLSEQVGAAYTQGVAKGIENNIGQVTNASSRMMNAAIRAAKNVAQIASPSKVMEKYGQYLDQGLVEGMKSQLNSVKAASEKMMQAAIPDKASAAVPAAGGGVTTSFTQIINAPKTPSRLDLYRDTKNLLALAGGLR